MTWEHIHPAINAVLNATCAVLLLLGRRAIRRGDRAAHRRTMLRAFVVAIVFLMSYVARFATTGAHNYPGDGWDRIAYLAILLSHMALALAVVPLVLIALRFAFTERFAQHKTIVRIVWPMWMYVSVTGVVVYVMLYQLAPLLHSGA